jgi:UDP-GlcNAc:undecaprenyl-phosphate GlcNAc-1-phosphate transferase
MELSDHQAHKMIILGLVFFASLISCLVLSPLVDKLAWKAGLVDWPNHRKGHTYLVTRSGGLAMAAALFLPLLFLAEWSGELIGFWAGAGVLLVAGIFDDKFRLSSKSKFAAQIAAVVLFMYLSGFELKNLGNILGTGDIHLGVFAPWITVLAMVGVINAFNLSDGLDGLAVGMAGIACLFFLPFAYAQESWVYLLLLTGLLGSLLGFLRHNFHPAKMFMGDTGSMFLGFTLAAAAVVLTQGEIVGKREYFPITALIILSLPVWDTLFVMALRLLNRRNPFKPDQSHLHYRLVELGLSHQMIVSLIYGFMFIIGVCAWLVRPWPEWVQFYSLLVFYGCLYTGLRALEKKSPTWGRGYPTLLLHRLRVKLHWIMVLAYQNGGKVFTLVWAGFLLPAVYMGCANGGLLYYLFFIFLLIVIYFPWRGRRIHMPLGHGLMFFGVYSILLIYNLKCYHTIWFTPYMNVLAAMAGIWSVLRVVDRVRVRLILPGGLELIFLGSALVAPILLHYSFNLREDFRIYLVHSFLQALPLLFMIKTYLRRKIAPNRKFIVYILALLAVLMAGAVL